ncbi:DASH complex subunit Hsk3 like-domain-containing protein [Aspergillus granulosus]|uniref:DASH complex subunit Hsk3 like-domain-containing protein n=1 Tax=Aspergillus granulosus TaxID=176169 RepID=A0ABR4HX18_9EURO
MAPSHQHSHSQSFPRHSVVPSSSSMSGSSSMSAAKARQYAHLHSQLAQLNAHLADTENLLRMTAVQAEDMRFLGGYVGALFMGSAKVLGEEGVKGEGTSEQQQSGDEKS